jgi:hypothetical protein
LSLQEKLIIHLIYEYTRVFFCVVLGFELWASRLLGRCSTSPFLVLGIVEIGSGELFSWAVFEPRQS